LEKNDPKVKSPQLPELTRLKEPWFSVDLTGFLGQEDSQYAVNMDEVIAFDATYRYVVSDGKWTVKTNILLKNGQRLEYNFDEERYSDFVKELVKISNKPKN
jgi:hypothetical protein